MLNPADMEKKKKTVDMQKYVPSVTRKIPTIKKAMDT